MNNYLVENEESEQRPIKRMKTPNLEVVNRGGGLNTLAKLEYANELIDKMQEKIHTYVARNCTLEIKYNRLKVEYQTSRAQLKETVASITGLQSIIDGYQSKCEDYHEEGKNLRRKIAELEEEIEKRKEEEPKCGICLENFKEEGLNIKSTRCGHLFCNPCLSAWVIDNHSCPTCREPITTRSSHFIWF